MSTNEQERGRLILPSTAIVFLRNLLSETHNKRQMEIFALAEKVHAHLRSEAGKDDRKALSKLMRENEHQSYMGLADLFNKILDRIQPQTRNVFGMRQNSTDIDSWDIQKLLITAKTQDGEPRRLQAPKKKDLNLLLASKTWAWYNEGGEFTISLDAKTRMLTWDISSNNHAVDNAHDSRLGKALFGFLAKLEWTRGTGGLSYYNNEYMDDSAMEGGSSVNRTPYGPVGKKIIDDEFKMMMPRRRASPKR